MAVETVVLQIEAVAGESQAGVRAQLSVGDPETDGREEGVDLVDVGAGEQWDRARLRHGNDSGRDFHPAHMDRRLGGDAVLTRSGPVSPLDVGTGTGGGRADALGPTTS
ncbi:hypothetical protein [Microlunatus soli]|uniref:hypothetical protein n=1 Tax=Microlunatus soli TaxID=630515 RepID=UPI0012F75C90|nr:hypothetical protein [Microlunatus soli]